MRTPGLVLLTLVVGLALAPGAARAAVPQPTAARRIAVVRVGDAWLHALRVALEPWELRLVEVEGPPPSTTFPAARERARALAQVHAAAAVIWITDTGGPPLLWIYDAEDDQMSTRPLPGGVPGDAPGAAAGALTAKAMLRGSRVAPPGQRLGAEGRRGADDAARTWRIDVGVSSRWLLAEPADQVESAQEALLSFWPRALAGRWGFGVTLASGPGLALPGPELLGRFTRTSMSAWAALRVPLPARTFLEPAVGATLHLTSLDGFAPDADVSIALARTNPSLDAELRAGVRLFEGVELGVTLSVRAALRRQRYLIAGAPLLELPAFEPGIGLRAAVRF